jgi:uncharacterized protein DUF6817/aspartyl/asparaginyl beta-hydroxylase
MSSATERHPGPPGRDDPTAEHVVAFLEAEGASGHRHAGGRNLLAHLMGTYEIARRWEQPPWLQHAALIHSVYGTEAYRQQLIAPERRRELRELVGERAERLAFLFAVTPRRLLFAGTHRWVRGPLTAAGAGSDQASTEPPATGDELDALVLLHLANLADQACAPDGSPSAWLVDLREMAEIVFDSHAVTLPLFLAQLAGLSEPDEAACRDAYRDGLAQTDRSARGERLGMAAARCPVVAEPGVWLAYEAWRGGEPAAAREWAEVARSRLQGLGTCWDKRLRFEEWRSVIHRLETTVGEPGSAPATDPRALLDEVLAPGRTSIELRAADRRLEPAAGAQRFGRYMGLLADAPTPAGRLLYPGLEQRPWWEPTSSPVAVELASHAEEIREEVLALDPSRFAPESERIPRTGDWDVVFLYERGRRHDDVCAACPTTTRVIEGDGAMRSAAGLIYVSRMRPGTHIEAHRTWGSRCLTATAPSASEISPAAGARESASSSTTPMSTKRGTTRMQTGSC